MTINSSFCSSTLPTMSDPSTPAPATHQAHSVTPASTIAARLEMADRFDPGVVRIMGTLLDPSGNTNDAIIQALDAFLFTDHWQIS